MPNTKPLLGPCDSYQLEPLAYIWSWEMSRECEKNTWTPEEIPVAPDVQQWRGGKLLGEEQHLFLAVMAQLTTFDIQRGDDAAETALSIFEPAEVKHFLKRMCWEEALHTRSYRYIIENFGLDLEIYDRWRTVPSMKARVDFGNHVSDSVREIIARRWLSPERKPYTTEEKQIILVAMVYWFLIFEGVWFVMSLAGPVQALSRNGKMAKAAEQFSYILRDEAQHIRFGTALINEYVRQYPEAMNAQLKGHIQHLMQKGIDLERDYIRYCIPTGILGYNVQDHVTTAEYYADQRLQDIGIAPIFGSQHKFSWFGETTNLLKEKNFFESRVTEYQTGGALDWGDNE